MIKGFLYEINSSSYQEVELIVSNDEYIIQKGIDKLIIGDIKNLKISSRLGNVPRKITLEDKRVFSTLDNNLVDSLLLNKSKKNILHKLESNIVLIFVSLVITIVVGFSFVFYGIPLGSKKLAFILPIELNKTISNNLLKTLDESILHKSDLSELKKQEVLNRFENEILKTIENSEGFDYKIHFRNIIIENKSIANAFALPNGDIVLTDALIRLGNNSDEIDSVIYHEIGHIKNRHSLQKIIQNSFFAIFMIYLTGDLNMASDFAIGIGSAFVYSKYSKTHELEADKYALDKLLVNGIDPKNFSSILNSLNNKNSKKTIFGKYFSSHPSTKKRVSLAQKYSNCYNKNIYPCK